MLFVRSLLSLLTFLGVCVCVGGGGHTMIIRGLTRYKLIKK